MAVYEALRPVMALWYAYLLSKGGDVPSPRSAPNAQVGDSSATRVLLLGNGPCHGWGVASHTVALAGGLAGELANRNARGARVDYIGDEIMTLAAANAWLGDTDLSVYDWVVVVVGMNDSVRLAPVPAWRRDLDSLVGSIRQQTKPGVRIALSGIQPVRSVPVFNSLLGAIAERHARRLSREARSLADEHDDIDYFELGAPQVDPARPFGSPAMYRQWASSIASVLKPLPRSSTRRVTAAPSEDQTVAEVPEVFTDGWEGLPAAVRLQARSGLTELERIVREAQGRFGVRLATISLADGDRLRYVGGTHTILPVSVPLELTHCREVIDTSEPLVVSKSSADPRFSASPLIAASHIEFYAGHPIQSSSGETIGSFCLMNPFPKKLTAAEQDELRGFALRAQAELQRLESDSQAASSPSLPGTAP